MRYYDAPAYVSSPLEQAPAYMVTALKISYTYGKALPTVRQLVADFGMHRSTAWRWRRAIKDALGGRMSQQLDIFRDDRATKAREFRIAAETARRDPNWTPEQGERRARYYEAEAEKLEAAQ